MSHKHITRRRLIGLPIFGWLTIAGGVAMAAFLWTLFVTGSWTVANGQVAYQTTIAPVTSGGCAATYTDPYHLDITWSPFPGDACVIDTVQREDGNTVTMQLVDFDTPAGVNVTALDCGAQITSAAGNQRGVSVTLQVDAGSTAGEVIALGTTTGFIWTPASQATPTALCP